MTLHEKITELRREKKNSALVTLFFTYISIPTIWLCMTHPVVIQYPILLLPLWFLFGLAQYYIVISGHEAVHKTLCHPIERNEFLGVFGQALVGVNFTAYRQQHIDHHKSSSYIEDPDAHIYMGVIRKKKGLQRFLFLTFGTLIEIFVKIRQKGSGGFGSDQRKLSKKIRSGMNRDSKLVIIAQITIMLLTQQICLQYINFYDNQYPTFENNIVQNNWYINMRLFIEGSFGSFYPWFSMILSAIVGYALFWIVPLFGVTVFLNRCRIVIEHGLPLLQEQSSPLIKTTHKENTNEIADEFEEEIAFKSSKPKKKADRYDITHQNETYINNSKKGIPSTSNMIKNSNKKKGPRIPTIDILPPKWQQIIFSPFSFNYHCTHHLFMGVPHYNLHKLHQILREEEYPNFFFQEKSYIGSLREILDYEQLDPPQKVVSSSK